MPTVDLGPCECCGGSGDPCSCTATRPATGTVELFGATASVVYDPDTPDQNIVQQIIGWLNSVTWDVYQDTFLGLRPVWEPRRHTNCNPLPSPGVGGGFGSYCYDSGGARRCENITGPTIRRSTLPGGSFASISCGSDELLPLSTGIAGISSGINIWEFYSKQEWDAVCNNQINDYPAIKYQTQISIDGFQQQNDPAILQPVGGAEICSGAGGVWEVTNLVGSVYFYSNTSRTLITDVTYPYYIWTRYYLSFRVGLRLTLDPLPPQNPLP